MKIQYLNINEYKYRIEYIPYEESILMNQNKEQKFVMIRNFSLMNNIVADDNIYFIERSIFDKYKLSLINKEENQEIVFPSNKDTMYYSSEYHIFNDSYIDNDIVNEIGVYDLLYKTKVENSDREKYDFTPKSIPCDLIKIYHPSIKTKQNLIVHIENVINNIHFHYICNTYLWYYQNDMYESSEEYRYENNIYSEYIKCYIPSIRRLFDRIILNNDEYDYEWYFKENLNIVDSISDKNTNFINKTIIKVDSLGYISDNENELYSQYVPMALFTQPCIIEEYNEDYNKNNVIEPDEKIFKKTYFKYHFSIDNNYITTPLNVSLYPYDMINKTTHIYTLAENFLPSSISIIYEYKFNLSTTICFDDYGNISLLNYFKYPLQELFKQKYGETALSEAYCFYHHIINRKNTYINNMKEIYMEELDEINSITDIDDETIQFLITSNLADKTPVIDALTPTSKAYYISKLKESRWQVFLEEYIDQYKASIDFFGFKVEIASDKKFKHIILSENISLLNLNNSNIEEFMDNVINNIDFNIFDNVFNNDVFSINLNGIFTDWKQMPEMVVARVTFIDRFIGNEIKGNEVFISKEKFKYITNVEKFSRLNNLVNLNQLVKPKNMRELNLNSGEEFQQIIANLPDNTKNKLEEWYNNYANNQYSFINKINCIVEDNKQDNITFNTSTNKNTQIVYKPIFFKTNKLNNVNIKYMQNQNIGIDLHEYISKVDLFIITLDGNTYYEIGRNANYVLFNISASNIVNDSGNFEVYNNDHEYITYGTWSKIK